MKLILDVLSAAGAILITAVTLALVIVIAMVVQWIVWPNRGR